MDPHNTDTETSGSIFYRDSRYTGIPLIRDTYLVGFLFDFLGCWVNTAYNSFTPPLLCMALEADLPTVLHPCLLEPSLTWPWVRSLDLHAGLGRLDLPPLENQETYEEMLWFKSDNQLLRTWQLPHSQTDIPKNVQKVSSVFLNNTEKMLYQPS